MTLSTYVLLIVAITTNAIASILLKCSSARILEKGIYLRTNVFLLAGLSLIFYALSFIVYAMVLRVMPISRAYLLITFGAQVVLFFAGFFFFGETYELTSWAGVCLIVFGLLLVIRGMPASL